MSAWSDDDEEYPAMHMADRRKRRKGKGLSRHRKVQLKPQWWDHIVRTQVIPIRLMKGLSKREVYKQAHACIAQNVMPYQKEAEGEGGARTG